MRSFLSCSGRYFYRLIAALALIGQLAVGALPPPDQMARSQLQALNLVGVLCQSSRHAPDDDRRRPHHHQNLALLVDCASLPVALPTPAPMLPVSRRLPAGGRPMPLGARAPPSRGVQSGYPRGPPPILA